ncbi:MAG: DNA/RNA non-specific endonuclease [Pseudomonas sp.]|uniref:DNA/RNA non-specific endonuclease n=1 Tax=Pseudomonas sp. TaxID=306 RepID=UPI00339A9BD8
MARSAGAALDRPLGTARAGSGILLTALLFAACTPYRAPSVALGGALTEIRYRQFTLWYDCVRGEPQRFEYHLDYDKGHLKRLDTYRLDPAFPAGCRQQRSTQRYNAVHPGFDVGHLVPANQMDNDPVALREANQMPNLVPQYAGYNRRTWYATELVAECYRDLRPLEVIGGVVYGNHGRDLANDFFLDSHGLRTPEAFWKVLLSHDALGGKASVIAWYIPHGEGLGDRLDPYLLSVRALEKRLGPGTPRIRIPEGLKDIRPATGWPLPRGCERQ